MIRIVVTILVLTLTGCASTKPHRESTADNTCLACEKVDDTLPGQIVIWRK